MIVRTKHGDKEIPSENELAIWLEQGLCSAGDFVYCDGQWQNLAEHRAVAALFNQKPEPKLEKLVIYVWVPGRRPYQSGPFSVTEVRQKVSTGFLSPLSWIFIEGDREWRQVRAVKALKDLIPAMPTEPPSLEFRSPLGAANDLSVQVEDLLAGSTDFSLEENVSLPDRKVGPATRSPIHARRGDASISMDLGLEGPKSSPKDSITMDTGSVRIAASESANQIDTGVEHEERTQAFSVLGLSLNDQNPAPTLSSDTMASSSPMYSAPTSVPGGPPKFPAAPASVGAGEAAPTHLSARPQGSQTPPPFPAPTVSGAAPAGLPSVLADKPVAGDDSFDGVTAEISTDPIWLVKAGAAENTMGPFRFLEVTKFLEDGKLTKNDKISKVGTNRFNKIAQQYEFNVKYTIENVVEAGVEKQKIFIRRRHPRVSYLTNVQIQRHGQTILATVVNISAGGVLIESPRATFALGETISIKVMPGLIPQAISCDALVIGKVPKIPPGFALKFKDLKQSDKEAIEFFVQETIKKEQQRAM